MLPADVLKQAQQELCDWNGLGTSVMEISHRGKEFIQVAEEAEKDFRDLLNIPFELQSIVLSRRRTRPVCRVSRSIYWVTKPPLITLMPATGRPAR